MATVGDDVDDDDGGPHGVVGNTAQCSRPVTCTLASSRFAVDMAQLAAQPTRATIT